MNELQIIPSRINQIENLWNSYPLTQYYSGDEQYEYWLKGILGGFYFDINFKIWGFGGIWFIVGENLYFVFPYLPLSRLSWSTKFVHPVVWIDLIPFYSSEIDLGYASLFVNQSPPDSRARITLSEEYMILQEPFLFILRTQR